MIGSPGIGDNNNINDNSNNNDNNIDEASINQTHNFNESYKCDEDPDQVVCWGQPATADEYIKNECPKNNFRRTTQSNTTTQ